MFLAVNDGKSGRWLPQEPCAPLGTAPWRQAGHQKNRDTRQPGHPRFPEVMMNTRSLAAGRAGAASAARILHLERGIDVETHMRVEFHGNGFGFVHQGFFDKEGIPLNLVYDICILLLIQSKRQARPASACRHVNPDRRNFLSRKMHIELLFGSLGQFKHNILLVMKQAGSYCQSRCQLSCRESPSRNGRSFLRWMSGHWQKHPGEAPNTPEWLLKFSWKF